MGLVVVGVVQLLISGFIVFAGATQRRPVHTVFGLASAAIGCYLVYLGLT
ncbi:MAG: hypothetical protein WEB00_01320 [Dehalococcoidia bacterium]